MDPCKDGDPSLSFFSFVSPCRVISLTNVVCVAVVSMMRLAERLQMNTVRGLRCLVSATGTTKRRAVLLPCALQREGGAANFFSSGSSFVFVLAASSVRGTVVRAFLLHLNSIPSWAATRRYGPG
ncbi:hypothetical protein IF1G_06646 [Cordyceps javanica]|uniref:Uncharacterized protein n=1 Tax=Cordyceps javanica TaxID=43265 RepID=A0A545UYS3_9HYPO|nr:hypothetical protein IF1G_06646 [Cordyceps javanica]